MIQRIQTVYLIFATLLMVVTSFSPLFQIDGEATLLSYGIMESGEIIKPTWGVVSMAVFSALVSFIAIFMFANRNRQKNMLFISILAIVLFYITTAVYITAIHDDFLAVFLSPAYGIFLPIIALILLIMAIRAITKDEKLVRSLNRIR